MNRVALLLLLLPFGIIALGCEPTQPVASAPVGPPAPPAPPPPPGSPAVAPAVELPAAAPPNAQAPLPVETKVGVFAGGLDDLAAPVASQNPAPAAPATPAADPNTEVVKAQAGVGKQGQSLKQYEGVVVTPVKSLFAFKQRAVFEIQIPHALQLFEASEGRKPMSHEEFMEKIVAANQIKLPELPADNTYFYDPDLGELMVKRPKLKGE